MEEWNVGMLGIKAEVRHYNFKNSFKPIIPLVHYFYPVKLLFYFTRATIPIGAKPLSSISLIAH